MLESHVVRVCSLESAACGQGQADVGGAQSVVAEGMAAADTVALVLRRLTVDSLVVTRALDGTRVAASTAS